MGDKHIVAITGIIIKGGKYLITQRSFNKKAFPGKWTVPGGRLEVVDYINSEKDTDEHWYNILEKVLRREVREEVGLEVDDIKYLTSMTFMRGEDQALIVSLFAEHVEGEVKLNEGSVDYKWVSLNEAREYDLIEGIYEELEMLDDLLRGEKIGEWRKRQDEQEVELVGVDRFEIKSGFERY
jgi:8-oxo-dGTP diphosphatase